ncbi:hypothetical protein AAES_131572 [Amazona aestiva]|uniref:Uncharacterized protein n=1 Tax=Amazona aestiva TaxID=12930 RepID=A0A0Q3M255_AMAAE|nr:hypothetical protein AAES_131572 [Amazona aestiva]
MGIGARGPQPSPNRDRLPFPEKRCQALPDLPKSTSSWEEEKLSTEGDRHGNRTEMTRLAGEVNDVRAQ